MREEPTRHWLQKTPVLKMAVTSVNSKTDSSMWGSETQEFTLVKNMNSSSGSMKPKRHNSWEERKTDRECDDVLVPSDAECVYGSESEDFDWSIGWLEPHGSGFPSMDEPDNYFSVLVPCYGRGYGGMVNDTNSKTLSNIRNFLDFYSAESIKSTDNWLFSWK